jgi:hypothetical protein
MHFAVSRLRQVGALQRELDEARHAANLHRRLLSAELRACERPASEGALPPPAVSPPPRRPAVPSPSQVLRDLGQWAGGGAAAAEPSGADCGSPARGASPRHLQRLQRLEAAADAASARFEALQHEHHKLRRQHQRLKQRLQREEDGARGAGVAGSGERPRRT